MSASGVRSPQLCALANDGGEGRTCQTAPVFRSSRFTEKDVEVRFHKPDLVIVHAVIEAAVRAVIEAFIDSWNRHGMRTMAALFARDADFVDVLGNWFRDRKSIERVLTQRHDKLSGVVDRQGQQLPQGLGIITSVIEKAAGGWHIIALQNTAVALPQS